MSSSYTTLGVNEHNQIPYLKGNNNIIHIVIDPPISVDLSSFDIGQIKPYIQGSDNVITISIGNESSAFKDVYSINGGTTLIFTSLNQEQQTVYLPNVVTEITRTKNNLIANYADGDQTVIQTNLWDSSIIKELNYSFGANSADIVFLNDEIINYNITYDENGVITKMTRIE